jgi:hypothetical protein
MLGIGENIRVEWINSNSFSCQFRAAMGLIKHLVHKICLNLQNLRKAETFWFLKKEKTELFRKTLTPNSEISKINNDPRSKFQLEKHVHEKFQFSNFYPDGLRQIFNLFSQNFLDFLKKISKFSNSENRTEYK